MTFLSEIGDKTFFAAAVSVTCIFAFCDLEGLRLKKVTGFSDQKTEPL